MGIRFSKSIKLGNYLRLNLSKSGVSATVGKKGASINIGKRGTFLNLSPSLVGVDGTGISYRKKLFGFSKDKKTTYAPAEVSQTTQTAAAPVTASSNTNNNTNLPSSTPEVTITPADILEEYSKNHEAKVNIHKYAGKIMSRDEFEAFMTELDSEASKELYQLSIDGDEDTIENFIGAFMNHLELAYDVRVNYELEDSTLYVDLDLPEIENINTEYPTISKGKIVYKKKTNPQLKEEYAKTVMSLGVFLGASFFNVSPYISTVVMSGFNSVRNKDGDLIDQYLYSVKFTRDIFEETDLSEIDDLYPFILRFENRINLSSANNFKAIKPYEMESVAAVNLMIEDAALALKELGYKTADINRILPDLMSKQLDSVSDYLREGLRLLDATAE
ncbi:MAG: DUF4236 domain-containing protein [Oscillospiraceae bacterium]|nr:DUF4236 domain-containing protein [Oscillospiraceae bacterium]